MSMTALKKHSLPKNYYPIILLHTRVRLEEMEIIRSKWPKLDILFKNVESIFKSRPGPKYQENKAEVGHYFPGFILVSPNFTRCAFFIKGFTELMRFHCYTI